MIGPNAFCGECSLSDTYYLNVKLHAIAKNIQRIINTIAPIQLKKNLDKLCPETLFVPHSSQFSSFFALTKLFASHNIHRQVHCIQACFCTKWGLLFIYRKVFSLQFSGEDERVTIPYLTLMSGESLTTWAGFSRWLLVSTYFTRIAEYINNCQQLI